ncbi:MAG: hypothetical protein K1060chlam1_00424 [Candidatus Anoxychlamydiales bacterium]|nr:hypothetical protein [Candidatus Anoxychlamydiales bacterium]
MTQQNFTKTTLNKEILENEICKNILKKCKEYSSTPEYFVSLVQKIIYELQYEKKPLAFEINNPVILGSIINNFFKSKHEDIIIQNLFSELSSDQVQNLKKQFSNEDIVKYIKKVSSKYLEKKKQIVPDIIFRPESGLFFKYKNTSYFFLSNFTAPHGKGTRLEEVKYNRLWAMQQGYNIIEIPNNLPFEGSAEVKFVKHKNSLDIIFGYGYRTDEKTIDWIVGEIKNFLKADFEKVNIIKAHMIDENYYHLDVALKEIPLIENDIIIDETILYYPDAFDEKTKRIFKKKYPNAIVLSKKNAESFACNSPTINKSIIIDNRVSEKLITELENRGLKVIKINLSEFFKAGGGGKCLICELDDDIFDFSYEKNRKIQMLESAEGVFDIMYINDPYMEGKIGSINKGLAQKQHENLIQCLKKEGAEILLMKTDDFRNDYDIEILRKAAYFTVKKHKINLSKLDQFLCEILYENDKNQSQIHKGILLEYDKLYNSFPEYSWSIFYKVLHNVKKTYGFKNLVLNNQTINLPEQLFDAIKKNCSKINY